MWYVTMELESRESPILLAGPYASKLDAELDSKAVLHLAKSQDPQAKKRKFHLTNISLREGVIPLVRYTKDQIEKTFIERFMYPPLDENKIPPRCPRCKTALSSNFYTYGCGGQYYKDDSEEKWIGSCGGKGGSIKVSD